MLLVPTGRLRRPRLELVQKFWFFWSVREVDYVFSERIFLYRHACNFIKLQRGPLYTAIVSLCIYSVYSFHTTSANTASSILYGLFKFSPRPIFQRFLTRICIRMVTFVFILIIQILLEHKFLDVNKLMFITCPPVRILKIRKGWFT